MNKQKLIEKIEALPAEDYKYRPYVDKKVVLGLVRQLDEPQKVTIPQFVAEVIEGAKEESPELEDLFRYIWFNEIAEEFTEWYGKKSNRDLFVRAWLDGYAVEKEKRYKVVMKKTKQPLYYNTGDKKLFFSMGKIASHFTRQQLKKLNFGWVFDCEGIELEEVEE